MTVEKLESTSTFKSMPDMWHHRVESTPDAEAFIARKGDSWSSMTWKEAGSASREISSGLLSLGIEAGQRAGILSMTRVEWILADMAIMAAGAATTTIYQSNTAEECRYILADCSASFCFAEDDAQVAKLVQVREQLPELKHVIVIDGQGGHDGWVITLAELRERGRTHDQANPGAYDAAHGAIERDDLATLIYTSGTTGKPKGVMLTHDAWVYLGEGVDALGIISPADRQFMFLPLAHSFAKAMLPHIVLLGVPTVVAGQIDTLVANMGETSPTYMAAVPRIFEKAYNRVVANAKEGGPVKWRIFQWAVGVGGQVSALRQRGKEPSGLLSVKYKIADKLVFSKLKERFGGRMRFFISGGAPLSAEIAEFFHACDILILEGFGLTESSAATVVNRPDDFVFGSVGKPLPGSEVKIADDGEILLRGRGIMSGYWGLPEATAETLNEEGWLLTGDIGTKLEGGHLKITDRKKELIVTAGGKNIAPAHFQNLLKARCPYVSQVLMHGDKRPFCVALITINDEAVAKEAKAQGLSWSGYADLSAKAEVVAMVQGAVDAINSELPSYETIKKIALLPEDLTVENGALTPSLKVKRRVVEDRYRDVLDGFYAGTGKSQL